MGGAIGDAVGSFYEGKANITSIQLEVLHGITDDTQLTLATCEAILHSKSMSSESIASKMLEWYNKRMRSGLGSSTLKALRDLQVGAHCNIMETLIGLTGFSSKALSTFKKIKEADYILQVGQELSKMPDEA